MLELLVMLVRFMLILFKLDEIFGEEWYFLFFRI